MDYTKITGMPPFFEARSARFGYVIVLFYLNPP